MDDRKNNFIIYLNQNASHCINIFVKPWIEAVLDGDFSKLPENPSDDDWHVLALMVDGYALSEQLGLGELGHYLTNHWLPKYLETGALPDKTIELWIFLYGMQRREKWKERPLEGQEKEAVLEIYSQLRQNLFCGEGVYEMIESLE